jgi:methylmalonyl-CoA mutase
MNGAVLPIMAFYIACAKENGVDIKNLKGTIQNDILKEFMVRNTYIFPPKPSMRIISDIFKYVSKEMPKFNSISVSGYHMQEAGASAEIELAYTLLNGLEYLRTGIEAGLKIDDFAPRISFFWGIGMNFFTEIAKMRAGRLLWAKIVKSFNPKNPKSMSLRAHCQTSGWSLTEQDPYNNICRTAIEALGAVLGGTQSLHTNSLDEAIALPTEFSAKIARDTQKYLQTNTGICEVVDPLGGSYYIEYLTDKIYKKSWAIIEDIEKNGGMIDAITSGIPKTKIEKVATIKQAKIDSGKEIIVGLNKFEKNLKESKFHLLEIDNKNVIKTQTKKLIKNKKIRNESDVSKILKQITSSCKSKKQNLLTLAVEAAEKRATLAEIIGACEKVFKRYTATNNLISGFYMKEIKDNDHFKKAKKLSDYFYEIEGRRARILVAKMGQDGHDRGAKIVATSFSDMGFDVDIGALFQTPDEVVNQALINDVHIIGISSLAAGHTTNVPEIIKLLKKYNREDILIVLGGVIPENQHKNLIDAGVDLIFGPGSVIAESACNILSKLIDSNESRG